MTIDTRFFTRCIQTLERAYHQVTQVEEDSIDYEMYRSASVKEFEIILEQAGKLIRKCLKDFMHSPKSVDRMVLRRCSARQHSMIL